MIEHVPAYCRQKRPGKNTLAYVQFDKIRRVYLGEYGSDESKEKYRRILAEWAAAGGTDPVPPADRTIDELVARFWAYVTLSLPKIPSAANGGVRAVKIRR